MYIDALYVRDKDIIKVVERRKDGKRDFLEYPANYSFYVKDDAGSHLSIFRDNVRKIEPSSYAEFVKIKHSYGRTKLFESDINYTFRALEDHYLGTSDPEPHVAFFDIETDFDKELGYSSPEDAVNKITAISVYLQWMDQMICLAVPPKTLTLDEAQVIADDVGETILFEKESEMLSVFLTLIEDADILSGWNSEIYDIPYVVNRIVRILGKQETRKLCLWGQLPRKRYIDRGGKQVQSYNLVGRVQSDYLQLYKKYQYEERHSYSLDAISEIELGEKKVPYDGTLDQLYNSDFKKFLEYSIQDTRLLDRLDKKLKYIELLVSISHASCVLLPTAMGTVSMVNTAITLEAHRRGMVVPDRTEVDHKAGYDFGPNETGDERTRAAGGWVCLHGKPGLAKWIGSSDLTSLYPSVIRALNMSPETLIGQVNTQVTEQSINDYIAEKKAHKFSDWWNDRFNTLEMQYFFDKDSTTKLILDMEDGTTERLTGSELHNVIFNSGENWTISANGTIFRTDIEGVVPSLLTRWFNERKRLQGIKEEFSIVSSSEIEYPSGLPDIKIQDTKPAVEDIYSFRIQMLSDTLETKDMTIIQKFFEDWGLYTENGKVHVHKEWKLLWKRAKEFWDKQQLVRKISLNSAYGGILHPQMKFFDQRIGQSTTLTGRTITRHMTAKTNEILCGEYDHDGKCVIYNDTDSVYFSAWPALEHISGIKWDKEIAIKMYNKISDEVSDTFPEYLKKELNVPLSNGTAINSAREIVAKTGLFIKKKRYACLVYDKDGHRKDADGSDGILKAVGLDLKRSDTPKFMQEFLSEILKDVLNLKEEDEVIMKIRDFKANFEKMDPWKKGTPKAVNGITRYLEKEEQYLINKLKGIEKKGFTIPGHVKASHNWNNLCERYHDRHAGRIVDGQKIVVCPLKKDNPDNMRSVAYPIDELQLPKWFLDLPFDEDKMMDSIVDKKITNLLGVLDWDLSRTSSEAAHFETLFKF